MLSAEEKIAKIKEILNDDHGLYPNVNMPFGKFKGKSMGWLATNEPEYLDWAAGTDIDGWLKDAITQTKEIMNGSKEH